MKLSSIKKRGDKKGAIISSTLVWVIIAAVVMVVLLVGFIGGWDNLGRAITGWVSPSNVDTHKNSCKNAANLGSDFDYCCLVREVKFSTEKDKIRLTCQSNELKADDTSKIDCNKPGLCARVQCSVKLEDAARGYVGVQEMKKDLCKKKMPAKSFTEITGITDGTVINRNLNYLDVPIISENVCCAGILQKCVVQDVKDKQGNALYKIVEADSCIPGNIQDAESGSIKDITSYVAPSAKTKKCCSYVPNAVGGGQPKVTVAEVVV